MTPYLRIVFYNPEDGGYIAEAPDLEYCSAFGETAEKALEELERAMGTWLQAAKQNGRSVPVPSRAIRPDHRLKGRVVTGTTGKFSVQSPEKESDQPQTIVEQEFIHA